MRTKRGLQKRIIPQIAKQNTKMDKTSLKPLSDLSKLVQSDYDVGDGWAGSWIEIDGENYYETLSLGEGENSRIATVAALRVAGYDVTDLENDYNYDNNDEVDVFHLSDLHDSLEDAAATAKKSFEDADWAQKINEIIDQFSEAEAFVFHSPHGFANEVAVFAFFSLSAAEAAQSSWNGKFNGIADIWTTDYLRNKLEHQNKEGNSSGNRSANYIPKWYENEYRSEWETE